MVHFLFNIFILVLLTEKQKSLDILNREHRIGSLTWTLFVKFRLEGSSINWQSVSSVFEMSSNDIFVFDSLHFSKYSFLILVLT